MDESRILQYLYRHGIENPEVAGVLTAKVTKYDDIKAEVMEWLRTGEFREDGLKIEGYGAIDIKKLAPFMDGIGIYNFMVDLRDNPEMAKKCIADGFPIG